MHGFRYARLERGDVPLDPASLTMRVVHTDLRSTGTFACGDEDLNRLHEVVRWSFRGNAVDVPTDCPTRERIGWTGDYQVFAPTAARLYDVPDSAASGSARSATTNSTTAASPTSPPTDGRQAPPRRPART